MKRNPARLRAPLYPDVLISRTQVTPTTGPADAPARLLRSAAAIALLFHLPCSLFGQAAEPNATYQVNGQAYPLYETKDWVAVRVSDGASLQNLRADLAGKVKADDSRQPVFHEKSRILVEPVQPGAAKPLTLRVAGTKPVRVFLNGNMPPIVETEEFLVQFKPGVGRGEIDTILDSVDAEIARPLGDYTPNGFVARVRNFGQSIPAANTLSMNAGVIYAYPNFIWPKEEKYIPNDPLYGQQWHLNNTGTNGPTGGVAGGDIKAERAWEITRGSSNVVVAIVDDGVNTGHEDFKSTNKIQPGWDFVDNDNTPVPDPALDSLANPRLRNNHGTACAGLAVANGDNLKGGSGVAPGCRLMSVRLLGSNQTPESEAAAILSARDNGATIISNSWGPADRGGPNNTTIAQPCPPNVSAAITEVATNGRGGKGCIVLWAAGNGNESVDLDGYASHPHVICVGASNNQDQKASYSDFGDAIDIVAPGSEQDMVTTDRMGAAGYNTGNYTFNFNGTSAATPVAAGVCALLLSKEPNLTRSQVRQRLIDSADLVGGVTYDSNNHHAWYGYGRVNAWKALAWNDNTPPTATIRVPANNNVSSALAEADGTVSDTGTGIHQVRISLRDSLNRWWNWKTPGWSAPNAYVGDVDNHLALATVTGGTWKLTLPNLDNGSYRLLVVPYDKADNSGTTVTSDFNIDDDGPTISFTTPPDNSNHAVAPTVGGFASDFIQDRRYSLFREADGFWYDFSSHSFTSATFNGTTHVDIVPSGTGFWNYATPAGLDPGRYQVHAITSDTSGRFSGWTSKNFRVAFPPQVAVHTPPHGTGIQDLESIGGTVNDTSGMGLQNDRVSFTLYNDGYFWTGSSWTTTQFTLHAPVSGGSWSYTSVPSGANEKSGVYHISAFTIDRTGASSQPVSGVNQTTFRLDRDPPSVAIASPATGSTLTTASYQFRGTANDVGGIQAVNAFIRRASDSYYWNGSGWGISPIVLESSYNASNGEWIVNSGLPVLRGSGDTQLPNGNYNFIAIAIDNAGNYLQTDSLVTVDYHQIFNWTAGSYSDLDPNNNNLSWGNPANWSPNGVPAAEDIVNIDRNDSINSTVHRTVYGFHMSTGNLYFDNGSHSLTIRKSGSWTGGTLNNTVYIEPAATFALSGSEFKWLGAGGVVQNSGTVTWAGPGAIRGNINSIWNNKPGSTFTMLTDGDLLANYNGGNTFNNEPGASFTKSTGSGESYIDEWTFNNGGGIQSQAGTLHFNTTLNLGSGSAFAGPGIIRLNGTTNLTGNLTSTGNPELVGTLNATAATFAGTEPFVWSSGAITGNFTLQAGSVMNLTSGAIKEIAYSTTLTNYGRINWLAGLVRGNNLTFLNNESGGIFDMKSDGDVFANYNAGNTFNNKAGGLFLKSGKSAAPDGETYLDEWTFNNWGTIRNDTGVMRFHLPLWLYGGGTISRNGSLAAKVRSTHYFVLTGTTTVSNITLEAAADWHGNADAGTAGNGTIATQSGGVFEWTAGYAHNTVNIAAGSTFAISGPDTKWIGNGGVLNNSGNATWSGTGPLRGWGSSSFVNLSGATFTATNDSDWNNHNGNNVFSNRAGATFSKTAGAEDNRCDWAFDNHGTVSVSSGALAMNGGGTSSGTFNPTGTGRVQFTAGTHLLQSTAKFQGSGKTQFLGGVAVAVNPINLGSTATTFDIAGGTVTSEAAGSFNAIGTVNWTSGAIGGTFNLPSGSSIHLSGEAIKELAYQGVINNSGTATWTGPGVLRGNNLTFWNNKSGSSFTMLTDGDVFANYNAGNTFNNEAGATFVKTSGAGDAYIDEWTFTNSGILSGQQGRIHFNTSLYLNTGSSLAGAGGILLNGTTHAAGTISSTGNPELVSTLNANSVTFSGSNPFVWSSGAITGNFTLQAGSVMNLASGGIKDIAYSTTFTNYGRINWLAGLVRGNNLTVLNNESGGIFDMKTDGDVFANYNAGNTFNNKAGGLFLKSGKSAAPDGETFLDEWSFNNWGSIRSDTGVMRFHQPVWLYGGGTISRNGAVAAKVRSTHYFVLVGTTTVSNITFEAAGDWHGNLEPGTTGNGTIATQSGGVFEWTAGTAHNTVNIAAGSTFSIAGTELKWIGGGGVLNNGGTATRTGTGAFQGWGSSTLNNLAGGVFNVSTSAPFTNYNGNNRFTNSGTLNLGTGAMISPMHWSFTQTSTGKINVEIGGTVAATPEFDQLNISGDAVLAGSIGVTLVNGFAPVANTEFPVVTFGGGRTGTLASVTASGSNWALTHEPNRVLVVAKTKPTTFAAWKSYHFVNPLSNDALASGDPDKDGLSNIVEYGFGLNPLIGNASPTVAGIVEISGSRYLTLTYTRPAGPSALTDISYAGERSPGMLTNSWSGAGVTTHSTTMLPSGEEERVVIRSTQPIGGAAKDFLRARLVVTPVN